MKNLTNLELEEKYFLPLAASYARFLLKKDGTDHEIVNEALNNGYTLFEFKNSRTMPRVKKVMGIIKKVNPENLLEVGTGRGVFLWPLITEFPNVRVTTIDVNAKHALRALVVGMSREKTSPNPMAFKFDITKEPFILDVTYDCITALEVLEHIPNYKKAINQMVKICNGCIIVSVPSKQDENPDHIHLFTKKQLEKDFIEAGAKTVKTEYVLNSMILFITV